MGLSELEGDIDRQFEAVDRRFEETLALIASQEEKTRQYISTRKREQVRSGRNLVLDKAIAADERTRHLTDQCRRPRWLPGAA